MCRLRATLAATSLGLLCAWLNVLPLLHASHRHRFCDEHQTYEEDARSSSTAPLASDEHVACSPLSILSQAWLEPAAAAVQTATVERRVGLARQQALPGQVDLLRLAPKGSPPPRTARAVG